MSSERILSFPKHFSGRDPVKPARWLLGKKLVRQTGSKRVSGIIVETEAYGGPDDLECHAYRKKTERNAAMFEAPGQVYVYLIYGMYHCVNISCGPKGQGYAVLIRALEPEDGTSHMRTNRKQDNESRLCRGPGCLCQALSIDRKSINYEHVFTSDKIWLENGRRISKVTAGPRIGISQSTELPWRFYERESKYVSKPN